MEVGTAVLGPSARRQAAAAAAAVLVLGAAYVVPGAVGAATAYDPYLLRLDAALAIFLAGGVAIPGLRPLWPLPALLLVTIGSFSFWLWLEAALPGVAALSEPDTAFAASICGQCLLMLAAGAVLLALHPPLRSSLRRFALSRRAAAAAAFACLAFLVATSLLPAPWLGRVAYVPGWLGERPGLLLAGDALQGMVQELQFRGLLLSWFEEWMPRWGANLTQALLFGLLHVGVIFEGPGIPLIPLAAVLGLVEGAMVQRTGSLWPALILHALVDIWISVAIVPGLYGMS